MKTVQHLLLIITVFLCSNSSIHANHVWGGDISFTHISNNTYSVQLLIYRDCNGISLAPVENIQFSSPTCGSFTQAVQLQLNYPKDITPVCDTSFSSCNSAGNSLGIQEHIYKATVNLPSCWDNANNITISWTACCVPTGLTTIGGTPNIYIYAEMNASIDNNSPTFINEVVPQYCVNQPASLSFGFYETDKDSLVFRLTDCYSAANTAVSYSGSYNGLDPITSITGVTIDSTTGNIQFTPNTAQTSIICVVIEEYRNGVKISEVLKQQLITTKNCNNSQPQISGINGTIDSISSTGIFEATYCFSDTISFKINSFDQNILIDTTMGAQSISMEMNLAGQALGASFTTNNATYPQGTFNWTPSPNDLGTHVFDIIIKDDHCPETGFNIYTFKIHVVGEEVNVNSLNFGTFCLDSNSFTLPNYTPIIGGYWSGNGIIDSTNGIINTSQMGVGAHFLNYQLTDTFGCGYQENITIFVIDNYNVNAGQPDTVCTETTPFWFTGTPNNGTWTGNGVSSEGLFSPAQTGVGTFIMTYTNTLNNCIATDQKLITVLQTPDVEAGGIYLSCTDGTAQLTGIPAGGIWIGSGIDSTGFFDASQISSSLTSTNVIYQYSDGFCDNFDLAQINIIPPTTVEAGLPDTVKATDPLFALTGFSPTGGTWSGTGITDPQSGTFDPSIGNGTYTLTYTFPDTLCGNISDTKTIYVDFGVNTNKVMAMTDISVFPNPFSDQLIIHFENEIPEKTKIEMLNTTGQVIKEWIINENNAPINISENIASGIYFLKIYQPNEERVFKVIKQ